MFRKDREKEEIIKLIREMESQISLLHTEQEVIWQEIKVLKSNHNGLNSMHSDLFARVQDAEDRLARVITHLDREAEKMEKAEKRKYDKR
jgi:uncharacterized protein YoxC